MIPHIDKEKNKRIIDLVMSTIKTDVDPWLLEEYRRLFKKEVSLFHRSTVAAYFLMLCDQGKSLAAEGKAPRKAPAEKRKEVSPRAEPKQYPLADEESKRLFFSMGRSRRVFPREILGLIHTKTGISKEHIGAIRILDNYSFIQVRDTVAEEIIEALNGVHFRGRTLAVNYAKSRKDGESEFPEAEKPENDAELVADDDIDLADDQADLGQSSEQGQNHSEEEDVEHDPDDQEKPGEHLQ